MDKEGVKPQKGGIGKLKNLINLIKTIMKKEETLEENLACYTDLLNQYCATLDQIVKEYKEQSRLIANSLKDIVKFLKN